MTVNTEGGTDTLRDPVAAQSVAAESGRTVAVPPDWTAPGPFADLHARSEPAGSETAPHFLGALLIASSAGFISCVVALLFGRSFLEALAVYALTGGVVFIGLLVIRSGPDDAEP